MAAVAVVMGVLVACLAIPFAGLVGVAAKDVSKGMVNLPESLEAKDLSQKTRIYDVNGNLIASLYDQNRINVPLGSISRPMVKAIVAIEDYRFYEHGALDLKGTVRAFVTNQANGGSVQGGSSITQQMVKQTLLYQAETDEERKAATEETYARKIRELRYAIAFEKNHSKDWILERYLNIAYFGDGAFGVQSAARHFFSKNAKDLNLLESATLAGLVKNPVGYDPVDNPERAEGRRNVVLDRMAQLGILTEKKAERLKGKPLAKTLDIETSPNGCQQSRAPFFCDYVVNWLLKDPVLGDTPKERRRTLNNGGLTINTTIDLDMQKAADDSVASHVYQTDQAIGGLAMIEPGSGDVRALAQSRPMGKDKKGGETYLNYTVPKKYGDANGFQAGSTFKLFVLAAAINQGIPLSTSINSPQTMHFDDWDFETCDGPYAGDQKGWDPENSTGAGTFDLYSGTQQSVNTFFAQLETRTGMCEPLELAKEMGVKVPQAQQVPSWILGVSDADPLTMAQAYATFAARGLHCDPRPVTQVLDSSGASLKDFASQCEQVMPGATADAVNDILRGVMEGSGFGAAPRHRQAVGRQDRHQQQQHGGVVRRLHPDARHRRDGRRRQRVRRVGQPQRPDRRRQLHQRGLRLDRRRPALGRRDGRGVGQAALRGLPDAARRRDRRRAQQRARRGRPERRGRDRGAPGRRVHRRRRRPGQLRDRRRPGRLHLTRGRRPAQQRRHGDALHLDRLRAPAALRGQQRQRRNGNGNGGGRGRGNGGGRR